MLASTDPYAYLAVALVVLILHLAWRRGSGRERRSAAARALAEKVGHPSTFERGRRPVRINGLDGEYVADLGFASVGLRYETNAGTEFLGYYPSDDAAIEAIAAHEAAQTSG